MIDVSKIVGKFEEIKSAIIKEIGDEHKSELEKNLGTDSDIMKALIQYEVDELEDFFRDIWINIDNIRGYFSGETGCCGFSSALSCHTNYRTVGKMYLGQV